MRRPGPWRRPVLPSGGSGGSLLVAGPALPPAPRCAAMPPAWRTVFGQPPRRRRRRMRWQGLWGPRGGGPSRLPRPPSSSPNTSPLLPRRMRRSHRSQAAEHRRRLEPITPLLPNQAPPTGSPYIPLHPRSPWRTAASSLPHSRLETLAPMTMATPLEVQQAGAAV